MTTFTYPDIPSLMRAIRKGIVPVEAISPGGAAHRLGVSRQRVFQLIAEGRLKCWRTADGDVILVSLDDVKERAHARAHG